MNTISNLNTHDREFWSAIDKLVDTHEIIIDREKGSTHPKYKNIVYNVDYGFLKYTKSMDKGGIDIYVGSKKKKRVESIICIVDLLKGDSEIKLLFGCTDDEVKTIYDTLNNNANMKGILINR